MPGGDEFFGASGTRAALSDDLSALTAVANANLHEAQTAQQPAIGRKHTAEAEKLEMENQNERMMSDLMRLGGGDMIPGPGGQPVSMADRFDRMAELATRAGMPKKAADLAKTSSLLRSRDAAAGASKARSFRDNTIAMQHEAQLVGQLFGDVKDEAGWQRANDLYEFQKGEPSPFKDLPYSEDLVTDLNNQAMSAYQRGSLDLRAQRNDLIKKYQTERTRQANQSLTIAEARAKLAEEREKRLAKGGGGKGVTSPSSAEMKQAVSLLKQDYPGLAGAERDDAAYTIAAEARALRRTNPALDAAAAIQQAYQAAVTSGDIEVTPGYAAAGIDTGIGKKTSYVKGKRPETAVPINKDTKSQSLVEGRYYINPLGVVGKWNGKSFEPVRTLSGDKTRTPRPSPGIDPRLIDPEDDVELGDPQDDEDD